VLAEPTKPFFSPLGLLPPSYHDTLHTEASWRSAKKCQPWLSVRAEREAWVQLSLTSTVYKATVSDAALITSLSHTAAFPLSASGRSPRRGAAAAATYEIRSTFPVQTYADDALTLRAAGLVPNAALVLRARPA